MSQRYHGATPEDAARAIANKIAPDGYRFRTLHAYRWPDGKFAWGQVRCEHPTEGKWLRPMRPNGSGYVVSGIERPKDGRPLYRLPELLAADPSALVVVVEGEKAADALARLGVLVTTSGGATSADAADWSPLKGRSVLMWPDNDAPGTKYAQEVAERVKAAGGQCETIDAGALCLDEHGDAVDWLAMTQDATPADVLALPRVETPAPVPAKPELRLVASAPAKRAGPEPLPDPLPAVPAFNAELLPRAVRQWCVDVADAVQVPLDFTAIPAMVGLGGVVGRRVGIAMQRNNPWIEVPVLWGCVIGRPSAGKSPALSPTRRMLERLADEERAAFEEAMRAHEVDAMLADASKENAKNAVKAAMKTGDKAKAAAAAEEMLSASNAPTEPRILVNDATVEKLGELLNANPNGLIQYRDELTGFLTALDREGREPDRAFWLECWNGNGTFTVDRIGRGTVRIQACAMSLFGGIQPGKLAEYVRGAVHGGHSDDGLIQRLQLAVYPDLSPSWKYTDNAPNPISAQGAWDTFKRLRNIDADAIGCERLPSHDVPFLRMDDEAMELFVEWLTVLMRDRLRPGTEPLWMESHLAKYKSLVGRLALVIHLADVGRGPVGAESVAMALNWCEYLEGHARRIYSPAVDCGIAAAHALLKKRDKLAEPFTAREVHRSGWAGLNDREVVAEALEVLVEYGHLRPCESEAGANGGRPTVAYAWEAA